MWTCGCPADAVEAGLAECSPLGAHFNAGTAPGAKMSCCPSGACQGCSCEQFDVLGVKMLFPCARAPASYFALPLPPR